MTATQPTAAPMSISDSFKLEQERMKVDATLQIVRSLAELLYVETDYRTGAMTNRLGFDVDQQAMIRQQIMKQISNL